MTPASTPRRLRRTAAWLLATSLPVGIVVGAGSAQAAGFDYQPATSTSTAVSAPGPIAVDSGSGVVYVADPAANVVRRVAADGTTSEVVAGVEGSAGLPTAQKFQQPSALALSPDGKTLYVADSGNDVVVKVDVSATPAPPTPALTVLAGIAGSPGAPTNAAGTSSKLNDPLGLAVDSTGKALYIADSRNNQVEKLDLVSGGLQVFAGNGNPAPAVPGPANGTSLDRPTSVAFDLNGNLLVADAGNHAIDQVNPVTGILSVLGSTGTTGTPTSLAVDLSGSVFFVDGTSSLKRMTAGTVSAVTVDTTQAGKPVLGTPTAVATLLNGNLWLADATQVAQFASTVSADVPRITSAPPTTAAVAKPFSFRFTATGSPTPQWSFVDAKGPAGLTISATTGVLSGTPTTAGATTFTVRASNSAGHFDQVVTLTVGTLPTAPAAPTAVAGDGRAVVTWKPTAATGTTADVTGYSLTPFKDGVAQTPVTFTAAQATTQVVTGLTNGAKYTFTLAATNSFGTGTASTASTAVTPYATVKKPVLDVPVSRLAGKDRIETAVNSSKALFPTTGSAGSVVVSAAWKYADALAGARLASATSAPLLLTESDKLSASVGTEISRVLAPGGTIYVLGGSGTVSSGVETALTGLSPNFVVKRLSGDDRYDTAAKIAGEVAAQAPGTDTAPVYLASGVNFPDGLAVSALAARTGGVVLLTDGAVLPAATKAYLQAKDPTGARVVPVGGAAAEAAKALPAAGGSAARAIVGTDRFDTANLVARRFATGATPTKVVGVATGDTWPDALVGASAVGLMGGPLLLTSGADLAASATSALTALDAAKPLATGVVFGGEPSVPAQAYASFGSFVAQD